MPLIDRRTSALLVIDLQTGLMPVVDQADRVVQNAERLIRSAQILECPILATEQYPQGLGETLDGLLPADVDLYIKTSFGACGDSQFAEAVSPYDQIIVTGCEAHVCVLQTVFGLMNLNKQVFVVADAVGSRSARNRRIALSRMSQGGAEIVTTEMVMFEWLRDSKTPAFKEVQTLLK